MRMDEDHYFVMRRPEDPGSMGEPMPQTANSPCCSVASNGAAPTDSGHGDLSDPGRNAGGTDPVVFALHDAIPCRPQPPRKTAATPALNE